MTVCRVTINGLGITRDVKTIVHLWSDNHEIWCSRPLQHESAVERKKLVTKCFLSKVKVGFSKVCDEVSNY